jgi:hypothetical protein
MIHWPAIKLKTEFETLFYPRGYIKACIPVKKVAASACKEKNRSAIYIVPVWLSSIK